MATVPRLKDRRGTLSIVSHENKTENNHIQQPEGWRTEQEACNPKHGSTDQRDYTFCANPEVGIEVISALLYRSQSEGSDDGNGMNVAEGKEVECINEHLLETFCRRCDGDCRNCVKKED
ncbi:hypothetical protein BDV28DRAFT_147377 [Aspergillus coremiiformis]|uniref:Uncharacterized protein n=1 Tax=Aspergillus coremiiformis TaxID=138285 RepID=A0A5N6ZAB3_9EURO|nr:hypothetical protein BDV28DRAFT_147377 [Aspergillus coremiiformis]